MCKAPITLKNDQYTRDIQNVSSYNEYSSHKVACGACSICLRKRVREWAFRLGIEEQHSTMALFTTLTYRNENLVYAEDERPSLYHPHVQDMLRNIRKKTKQKDIRYYCVGEYGGQFKRPHYHLIIFNCTENSIDQAWKHGKTFHGQVTARSIAYCAGYCRKKQIAEHRAYQKSMSVPEYSCMSKGLGIKYLNEQNINYHLEHAAARIPYTSAKDSREKDILLPRYYRRKIAERNPELGEIIKGFVDLEQKSKELEMIRQEQDDALMFKRLYNEALREFRTYQKLIDKHYSSIF